MEPNRGISHLYEKYKRKVCYQNVEDAQSQNTQSSSSTNSSLDKIYSAAFSRRVSSSEVMFTKTAILTNSPSAWSQSNMSSHSFDLNLQQPTIVDGNSNGKAFALEFGEPNMTNKAVQKHETYSKFASTSSFQKLSANVASTVPFIAANVSQPSAQQQISPQQSESLHTNTTSWQSKKQMLQTTSANNLQAIQIDMMKTKPSSVPLNCPDKVFQTPVHQKIPFQIRPTEIKLKHAHNGISGYDSSDPNSDSHINQANFPSINNGKSSQKHMILTNDRPVFKLLDFERQNESQIRSAQSVNSTPIATQNQNFSFQQLTGPQRSSVFQQSLHNSLNGYATVASNTTHVNVQPTVSSIKESGCQIRPSVSVSGVSNTTHVNVQPTLSSIKESGLQIQPTGSATVASNAGSAKPNFQKVTNVVLPQLCVSKTTGSKTTNGTFQQPKDASVPSLMQTKISDFFIAKKRKDNFASHSESKRCKEISNLTAGVAIDEQQNANINNKPEDTSLLDDKIQQLSQEMDFMEIEVENEKDRRITTKKVCMEKDFGPIHRLLQGGKKFSGQDDDLLSVLRIVEDPDELLNFIKNPGVSIYFKRTAMKLLDERIDYYEKLERKSNQETQVQVQPNLDEQSSRHSQSNQDVRQSAADDFIEIDLRSQSPVTDGKIDQLQAKEPELNLLQTFCSLPERFLPLFKEFMDFNQLQKDIYEDAVKSNISLAISAPTGCGKTVAFELGIIKLLADDVTTKPSVVLISPLKSICNEKFNLWNQKFKPYNLTCIEVTGDTEYEDFQGIERHQIIITTPEKWDSLCRKTSFDRILKNIQLVLLDEIHTINDELRGPVIETIVTRMKCLGARFGTCVRFISLSATTPNIEDISAWLSYEQNSCLYFKIGDESRPVKLITKVIGYSCQASCNDFMFDNLLNHRIFDVITTYSNRRPTLIFASTRKTATQTAEHLAKKYNFVYTPEMARKFDNTAMLVKDSKLKVTIKKGVAYHHAGLDFRDRVLIENEFRSGLIPVLVCTSTLSQGVNLPAHLVIIKGTFQYVNGKSQQYDENQILQMIGRAGRPQYDREAKAIIMTKSTLKAQFEHYINSAKVIESALPTVLAECLNTEIYLSLIQNRLSAFDWIRSTYFFVRIFKNPKHYGFDENCGQITDQIKILIDKELDKLLKNKLIEIDQDGSIISTDNGKIMATFYVSLKTMQLMAKTTYKQSLISLLELLCSCPELLQENQVRNSDKEQLNQLNAVDRRQKAASLRFPLKKPFNTSKKINCLIQSFLGCVDFGETALKMETIKIMKTAQRASACLLEYLLVNPKGYMTLLNAVHLAKSIYAGVWENSSYVSKQLPGVGVVFSQKLTNAGFTTIKSLQNADSRRLELIVGRLPPFGQNLIGQVRTFPEYQLDVNQHQINAGMLRARLTITATLVNFRQRCELCRFHSAILLVGDEDDNLLLCKRITNSFLSSNNGSASFELEVEKVKEGVLYIHIVSEHISGIDKLVKFNPHYHSQRARLRPIDPDDQYYLDLQYGNFD